MQIIQVLFSHFLAEKKGPAPRGVKQALGWIIGPHRVTMFAVANGMRY